MSPRPFSIISHLSGPQAGPSISLQRASGSSPVAVIALRWSDEKRLQSVDLEAERLSLVDRSQSSYSPGAADEFGQKAKMRATDSKDTTLRTVAFSSQHPGRRKKPQPREQNKHQDSRAGGCQGKKTT